MKEIVWQQFVNITQCLLRQMVDGLLVEITTVNWETVPRHKEIPTQIISTGVSQGSVGFYHSLVLKTDGSLWAFGRNNYGQLGDGTTAQRNTPTQIISTGVSQVSAGFYHSLSSLKPTDCGLQ